jgi:3-methyladenine DNA glycosylase/8-oxoguanine DNA glycosylase
MSELTDSTARPDSAARSALRRRARSHLREADPVLAQQIDRRPHLDPLEWTAELPPMDLFGVLTFQITGQQLSVVATRRTIARLQDLFDGRSIDRTSCCRVTSRYGTRSG